MTYSHRFFYTLHIKQSAPYFSCGVVTCNLGTILNRASITITIVVTPTTPGVITNTATVSGNEDDPDSDNNTATEETTVISSPPPPEIVEYVITLGKIRQVIPTGRFKDELFKEMEEIRGLLDIWDIKGALKILYKLKNTVTKRIIKGYGNAIKLYLLLTDLERLEIVIKSIRV